MLNVVHRDKVLNEQRELTLGKSGGARLQAAYMGVVEMSPAEWAGVFDNPRQRNTERRAASADHLKVLHPSHVKVNMAVLPDGRRFKLDGHTRSFVWESGEVQPPPVLYVDVWSCPDVQAAKDLYETFDSRAAVESVTDQLYGARRDMRIEYKSELLRADRFVTAIRHAYEELHGKASARGASVYDLMQYWSRELAMLDECGGSTSQFNSGLVAGALITFRRYGDRASAFWRAFSGNAGVKGPDGMDAVQALSERISNLRADNALNGRQNVHYIIAITLSAFDSYREGYKYKLKNSAVKAYGEDSFRGWVNAAKTARRG